MPDMREGFRSAQKLGSHKRQIHPKKLFQCRECGIWVKTRQTLAKHMKIMHEEHEVQRCEFCERTFKNIFTYKTHERRFHGPNAVKYSCQDCDKSCNSKAEIEQHYNYVHRGITHKCSVCPKSFSSKKNLLRHQVLHGTEEEKNKFPCPHCTSGFAFEGMLRRHIKQAHDKVKNFLCTVCGKRFPKRALFKEHTNSHLGIRPHVCEVCGKGFSSRASYRQHIVIHAKEKKWKCKYCGKGFAQYGGLKSHVKTAHEKELPHECSVCNRKFVFKAQLNKHVKIHDVL